MHSTNTSTAAIVTFHDRGVGREHRNLVGGKVVLRENADNEMLYPELTKEVELQIANGLENGSTSDPCYPDWYIMRVDSLAQFAKHLVAA